MRIINLALGLALLLGSCSKENSGADVPSITDSLPAVNHLNVSYGTDEKQKLDIYLPEFRDDKTRLVVIIHGGGWNSGDKSDFDGLVTEFQRRFPNYALANLNYRLMKADGNYFPTQENDVNAAITFLKDKSAEYKISQQFIYMGFSAGAHLAMLQGYKHNDVLQPKGIISFFGPTDLEKLYLNAEVSVPAQLKNLLNATLEVNPNLFFESSPLNYVSSNSAPTLMLHGDQDNLVPVNQAYMLQDKLEEKGVFNKLIVYPGQGHGWGGVDLLDSFDQVEGFIKGLSN